MNDTPQPQLQPLDPRDGESHPDAGTTSRSLTPKLIMAAAVIIACTGGVVWSRNASPPPGAPSAPQILAQSGTPASTQIIRANTQLALLAPDQAQAALDRTGFDADQKNSILAAIRNRRMRLVRMPIAQVNGVPGQAVTITSGGLRQVIALKPELQSVILPILMAGEVSIAPVTPPPAGGLQAGILTTLGPEIFPVLQNLNQQIVLDVIVQ